MDIYRQADNKFVIYRPAEKLNNAGRSLKRTKYTIKDWQALKKRAEGKGELFDNPELCWLTFSFFERTNI